MAAITGIAPSKTWTAIQGKQALVLIHGRLEAAPTPLGLPENVLGEHSVPIPRQVCVSIPGNGRFAARQHRTCVTPDQPPHFDAPSGAQSLGLTQAAQALGQARC